MAAAPSGRAAGLDGLRGLAALCVFVLHAWLYRSPDSARPWRDGPLDFVAFELRLAVPCFFVLSGYLLYRAFARAALRNGGRLDLGRYARRRAARILPAYYAALGGALLMLWGAGATPGVRLAEPDALPLFLLFAQNYSEETLLRLNPVTWSLCVEVGFYLLLPVLGVAAGRLGGGRAGAQAGLLVSAGALGVGWAALVHFAGWDVVAARALPTYLPYFALGALAALWVEHRVAERGGPPRLGAAATAGVALAGLALVVADGVWHAGSLHPADDAALQVLGDLPAGLGFALLVAAVATGRGPSIGWLRARPLVAVGIVSYGLYLWQVPVILLGRRLDAVPAGFLPTLLIALPATLAVAGASWLLLERPLIRRAAGASPRRRSGQAQWGRAERSDDRGPGDRQGVPGDGGAPAAHRVGGGLRRARQPAW